MTRKPSILNGERIVSSVNSAGKTEHSHAKKKKERNWTPIFHLSQKVTCNGLKTKCKTFNHKTSRRKHRENLLDVGLGNNILGYDTKITSNKAKINNWYCIKLKFLWSKRNNEKNEKVAYEMEENIFKLCTDKELVSKTDLKKTHTTQ